MHTDPKRIIDIHIHILPKVDDGSHSMEESLRMLRIAWNEGITDMIVTPHYQSGRYFTPAGDVVRLAARLQEEAMAQGIRIRLYPGTEIYYRSGLEEKLDRGQLSAMNGRNHVLVEFSPVEEFGYIRNAMEELRGMGYIPILAHVERFKCLLENPERVLELRRMGCGIQANAGSITGRYGMGVRHYLHKLLKDRAIDYIGTDAHNAEDRAPHIQKCVERLSRKYDADYVDALLHGNAEKNLLGEEES